MKKKYLHVIVVTPSGIRSENPLKISEVSIIAPLAQNNNRLIVEYREVDDKAYNLIFGKS